MNHRRSGRKTLQLAAQIRQTLELTLADVDEPVLADVMVDSVEPAGGGGQFVVVVTGSADPDEVLAALRMDSERRVRLVQRYLPPILRRAALEFAGTPGTRIFRSLERRTRTYICLALTK